MPKQLFRSVEEDNLRALAARFDHCVPSRWTAPIISTVLTLPAACVTLFFAGLSPMACDGCDQAQNARFTPSFETAFSAFLAGLALALVLLVTSWALPWRRRNAPRRVLFATLAPVCVICAYVMFVAMVDWP
ncbi:hypothetical protein [Streptomyces sp. CBMA152]|uniref:hypothetical protein n=1 Tax=Streptomyces sp. CBMA152 TaxID=1896312 RepID=UPI001CB6FA89|nr:hypothetical protein [Streptomyces sp. CBMA152]MBD0741748.1 hypothetical protein [Streptomyces sp. CBMA152]